jgi:glycosyltransferase involved in cell wall biosynthesis
MRIALVAARLPPATDGVGDHADKLARALAAAGHEVTVISAGDANPSTAYRLERVGGRWSTAASARAIGLLRGRRIEGVLIEYTPFLYGARSPAPLAVLAAARALGVRNVLIVHEAFYAGGTSAVKSSWKAALLGARDTATISLADVIAVPSRARANALTARLPATRNRVVVVPIGANIEPPANYHRAEHLPATVVSFGVVMPRRRLEHAINAVAQLAADGNNLQFDIIGRTHDKDYAAAMLELAARRGIGDRVRFRGQLAPAQISNEFGAAVAAVHAPHEGSIPSSGSLLALLAHGVPTIALRTAADDDVFRDALIFADDEPALAKALREIVREPQTAKRLESDAQACYQTNFAWATAADRLQQALLEPLIVPARPASETKRQ